ncbi:uncharacterized protein LOC132530030 [Lagenorhynchus albirostris]|uniref:uncharacterized protein LOC132530030 n=1 Tax=Lagenorhynchus albirostris TaxID=27610 RepID=UPI0028E7F888|nr:uncharacterized protein LOC132530030 [Lagenorhynchus albirostris]
MGGRQAAALCGLRGTRCGLGRRESTHSLAHKPPRGRAPRRKAGSGWALLRFRRGTLQSRQHWCGNAASDIAARTAPTDARGSAARGHAGSCSPAPEAAALPAQLGTADYKPRHAASRKSWQLEEARRRKPRAVGVEAQRGAGVGVVLRHLLWGRISGSGRERASVCRLPPGSLPAPRESTLRLHTSGQVESSWKTAVQCVMQFAVKHWDRVGRRSHNQNQLPRPETRRSGACWLLAPVPDCQMGPRPHPSQLPTKRGGATKPQRRSRAGPALKGSAGEEFGPEEVS